MQLSPSQCEVIEGLCLDKRPDHLGSKLRGMAAKLGATKQGEATIQALRRSLVPVGEWKREHPFKTKRRLTDDELRLVKAYVENPSVSGSASDAHMSVRVATRRWSEIYMALGVKSRPAALTASYLLGYWS